MIKPAILQANQIHKSYAQGTSSLSILKGISLQIRTGEAVCIVGPSGAGKSTLKDRLRFYSISLGSLREVQSVIELEELEHLKAVADQLGACLYKLVNQ